MHCIDEHGVPDPSMTEIQVSNSTVLCKLLVRGWTVKLVNFNITKYRLTSSDSVAFECKDNSSDAYTVTISENKTYVSQTNQKTVTVPFVCLPEEYTDDRTKLSESVITMQLLSVGGGGGGGGGSTSGSVTLKADDFNRAVLEFKNQVQLLSTVINQSNQSTTSAATTAADASQVAVATAAESAQSSSSTDNAVVQALNAVKEKLAALEVPQATIQNADNVSGLVKSLDGHISRLFAEMDQHNRRLLADFDARNKKLVQTILAASSHGPSTVPRAPPADEPSRQSTYSGSPKRVPKTTLSDGTEPIPNLKSLAKELEKVIAQSNTTTSNSFPPKTVSNTHILKGLHEYIIHDPFYRRKTLGCSYVFTPSQAEWRKSKNTKKVCVMVSTYVAQRDDNHQRLLNNLSTLSMLIVQIFPKTSIQNYPRVYVCDYDLTRQYNVVKDLKPQNDVTNPSNGFDFDFAMRLFEMRNTTEVFKDCFLETVPHFKTLFEQNGQTPESNFIQSLLPNDNIAFVKSKLNNKLRSNDTTSPYYKYMLGLKYEIQKFEEIQQAQTNNFSKLQNVRYFADSLPNDTKRAYLDEAIQQTIDKLRARSIGPPPVAPAPPAGDPPGAVAEASARSIGPPPVAPGAVAEASARSIGPPPVAPAPPAGDPPGAVAEARARSIGPPPVAPGADVQDFISEQEATIPAASDPLSNNAIILTNIFPEGEDIDTQNALVDEFHIMYKLYTILHLSKKSPVPILEKSTMYVMWLCAIVDYNHPKLYDLVETHFDLLQQGNYNYDSIHTAHVHVLGDFNVQVQGRSKLYPGIYSNYERTFRTQISDAQFQMLVTQLQNTGLHNELLQQKLKQIEPRLVKYRTELRKKLRDNHLIPPDESLLNERTISILGDIDAINTLDRWQIQKQNSDRDAVFYYVKNLLQVPKTDAVVEYISYCLLHLDQTTFFAQ